MLLEMRLWHGCETFANTYFYRTPSVPASDYFLQCGQKFDLIKNVWVICNGKSQYHAKF